jgi:hypothetical protein
VRPTGERVVERNDVAWSNFDLFQRGSDRHWHRAKMNGHVIALGNDSACGVKHRA